MRERIGLMIGVVLVVGVMTGSPLAQSQPSTGQAATNPAATRVEANPRVHNASGTVKSAAVDSLVIIGRAKGGANAEWTFTVDPKATKIRRAGKDISAADLAVGEAVHVRYRQHGDKHQADTVMVRTAKRAAEPSKPEPPSSGEIRR